MKNKEIKFYNSFEDMNDQQLNERINSSLQDRWDTFWRLRRFHKEFFSTKDTAEEVGQFKKRLIISKPEWI